MDINGSSETGPTPEPSSIPEPKPKQQQGQQANRNGLATERDIRNRLLDHGYEWKRTRDVTMASPYFVMQCKEFLNLVGIPWKVDFYIFHPSKWPDGLLIESKYQQISGSADQKLVDTVLSLLEAQIPCRLLIQGKGARGAYVAWCRQQAKLFPRLCVWSWDEMIAELNRGLL